MIYQTLISTQELASHLNDHNWVILDCRFTLTEPERGERAYHEAHIPGAVYAHLDRDLSGPVIPGLTGRHPLPDVASASRKFSEWGIGPGVQVVAYDDDGGALAAGRAWWMLRWLGHEAAAVLDGGWEIWLAEGRPVRGGEERNPARRVVPQPRPEMAVDTNQVEGMRQDSAYRLFDVRTEERYYGQNETIDPVAGHIPGAHNAPYLQNLTPEGRFRSPQELRQYYEAILEGVPPERAVFYCGSGVTSILSILAMEHAGLPGAKLYSGSWSEWIAGRTRPVETA